VTAHNIDLYAYLAARVEGHQRGWAGRAIALSPRAARAPQAASDQSDQPFAIV
jgi:hypothetical protein